MVIKDGTATYLGRLCADGHDHQGSGMSLRYRSSHDCIACAALRMARNDGVRGTTYVGSLCKRGHDHEGSGFSLRYVSGHTCVQCSRVVEATRRATRPAERRAQVNAAVHKWAAQHPEDAARRLEELATYRRSERGRQARLDYYARTRPARRAYAQLANRRRYARRHGVVRVRYTLADIAALFAIYGGRCAYCGAEAGELDHVVSLTHRGHDALYNLAPACRSCNASKGKRVLEEWYPRQLFFSLERMAFMAEQQIAAGLPTVAVA